MTRRRRPTPGRLGAALLTVSLLVGVSPAAAAPDVAEPYRADRVVVVGVPGLLWSDVDPQTTPQLWALAGDSAIGAMTVRAAGSTTCVLDGWASLGAGNRAGYPGVDPETGEVPGGEPGEDGGAAGAGTAPPPPLCSLEEDVVRSGLGDPAAVLARIGEDPGTVRFGAEPAVLGATVGCATVLGRTASIAVAADGVRLDGADQVPADQEPAPGDCPLVVASLDDLIGLPVPTEGDTTTVAQPNGYDPAGEPPASRPRIAALTAVDDAVGELRAALAGSPERTLLMLQGVSETGAGRPQLHVSMVSGPGFDAGRWLTSASTGRSPFVQLIDVAPTALRALGLERPSSMNGQALQPGSARPGLADAVLDLERTNTRAVVHHRTVGDFFWLLVAVNAALLALAGAVLGRSSRGPAWWQRARPAFTRRRPVLRVACLAVAAVPVSTYLAGLVPWERAGSPGVAQTGCLLVAVALVTAGVAGGPWRTRPLGPAVALLAVTLGTLVGDVLTGSHLELDGLLGYDAIVAGRFTGYGNLTFGLFATSALLLTAALAALASRRAGDSAAGRRAQWAAVAVAAVAALVLLGAPGLGRDFGGVLAGLPGFVLLAMLLAGVRVTVVRLALVVAVGVVSVAGVAVLDWLRPAEDRTQMGRFVAQLVDGRAWTVVSRKAEANLGILTGSALSWMLPVAALAAFWLLRRGGLLRSRPGGLPPADVAVLRAGLVAVAFSLLIGAVVNDSGVALPAAAAALLVPLLIWLVAGAPETMGSSPVGAGEPAEGRGGAAGRVSVTSRGSTGGTS